MPRKSQKLYVTDIKKLKPKDKIYSVNAGGGLILRVKTTGILTWLYNYYSPLSDKRTNLTLGDYPTISIDDAENKAREYKQLVKEGIDPKRHLEQKKREKLNSELDVFKVYAEKYFATKSKSLKESTIKKWVRYLEKDVYPVIGSIPVNQMEYGDGVKVRDNIIARGSYDIARKVCNYMNQIMLFTNVKPNPFEDLTKNIVWPKSINQKTIEPKELPNFINELSYSNMDVQTRLLIEFQLLTMVRPKEAARAQWEEIDFNSATWTIPPAKMKGKKGQERAHRVPLSEQAIEILKRLQLINGHSNWVFRSKYGNEDKPVSSETANKAIQRTAFKGKLVAHGLRSLAKTIIEEQGAADHLVAEAALAHVVGSSTTQAYTKTDYFERRKALMQWWSDFVDTFGYGKKSEDKVLQLSNHQRL